MEKKTKVFAAWNFNEVHLLNSFDKTIYACPFSDYNIDALSFPWSLWAIIPFFESRGPDWQGSKTGVRENPLSTIPQSSKDPDSTFANMSERWPNVTSSSNIQANQVQRIRGSPCGGNLITGFWEQCHFPPSFPTPLVLHHIDWSFMLFTCYYPEPSHMGGALYTSHSFHPLHHMSVIYICHI